MILSADQGSKMPATNTKSAPRSVNYRGHDPRSMALSSTQDIPYGCCECGCGQKTVVSPHTDRSHGWVGGEPRRFVAGHNNKLRARGSTPTDRGYATDCHIYNGRLNDRGYAESGGKRFYRVLWVKENGPVPEGFELDHLCRQRDCVRLDHLELVTHRENMRRSSVGKAAESDAPDPHGIRALRVSLGMSLVDVAERVGVSSALVGLWERGKVPLLDKYRPKLDELAAEAGNNTVPTYSEPIGARA